MAGYRSRQLAIMLEEDGTTVEAINKTLEGMAERAGREPENQTLIDNFIDLKAARDAMQEARQEAHAGVAGPTLPHSVVYAIDDGRQGATRQQRIEALTPTAAAVVCHDLQEDGFTHVTTMVESATTSGTAEIYFKPRRDMYITAKDHARELDMLLEALIASRQQQGGALQ